MNLARIVVSLACVGLTYAVPAGAQSSAAAETLFREARADMKAQRYAEACQKLSESQRLDPALGTLLNLATCEEKLGQIASAWAHFSEVVDLAPRGDTRARTAVERRDALGPKLPRVRMTGTPPPTATVELDGVKFTALGVLVPVDPGTHSVRIRRDGEEKSVSFSVKVGETAEVALPALEEKPAKSVAPVLPVSTEPGPRATTTVPERQPAPEAPQPQRSRAPGYALLGVGATGTVVALAAGALALGKKSTVADHCVGSTCDAQGASAARDGKRLVTIANVGAAVGVLGLGAAGWWFSTSPAGDGKSVQAAITKELW